MTVFYCIEDELSRAVAERLIREFCPPDTSTVELGKPYGGFGYIKSNLRKFHDLAQRSTVLIITDLDGEQCAPSLRRKWLSASGILEPLPEKMFFCIAQSEIESWLLADTIGLAAFLSVSPAKLAHNIETSIDDAKEYLVKVAKASSDASIRRDLTPAAKSTSSTGIGYNYRLCQFAASKWDPGEAAKNSTSLYRAISKLTSLIP